MRQMVAFQPSRNIKVVEYDADTQELIVTFHSGGTYRYDGVSQQEADGMSTAESAGGYLHSFIKNQHVATKIG